MHVDHSRHYKQQHPDWDAQSPYEELANSLVHGIGAALSVAGLVVLVCGAVGSGDAWRIVSFSVYGTSLFLLYLASTLHHSLSAARAKRFFEVCDHASIFLLIAGTYTPITLVAIRGPWGWTLFGLIWVLALIGILLKGFFLGRFPRLELALYIGMGWLVVIALKPLIQLTPFGLIQGLLLGGLCYTFGVVFFVRRSLPFHHTIWHLFVLAGSAAHFLAILIFLR
jgi:hemolysin III